MSYFYKVKKYYWKTCYFLYKSFIYNIGLNLIFIYTQLKKIDI